MIFCIEILIIHVPDSPVLVPSASSFYVPSIPGVTQDPNNPLQIFAGHIVADPNAAQAKSTDVISHLYFVMIKNRRIADKRRLMFWFNVGPFVFYSQMALQPIKSLRAALDALLSMV